MGRFGRRVLRAADRVIDAGAFLCPWPGVSAAATTPQLGARRRIHSQAPRRPASRMSCGTCSSG